MRPLPIVPARYAHTLRAVAAVVLATGYIDLIRGGVSVGPVLIVVGYAVLVPAVILTWQ